MLEREQQLGECRSALDAALTGSGRVLVVEGPAGIGKSRLLNEVISEARIRRMRSLITRGIEVEREVAFGAVRRLLDSFVRTLPTEDAESLFAGAAMPARGLFLPEAHRFAGAESDAFPTLNALAWILTTMADREPVAIAVDDVHWLDRPSIQFLEFLGSRVEGQRIAIVLATRPDDRTERAAPMAALVRHSGTSIVALAPLSRAAVRTLIEAAIGSPDDRFVDACAEATAGNPFYLTELLRELKSADIGPVEGSVPYIGGIAPRSISLALRFRGPPSHDALALAQAVAILGSDARLDDAAALAGLDLGRAAVAADELMRASIFGPGASLGFVHPIVETAIAAEVGVHERAAKHLQAASLLRRRGAAPEVVAAHLIPADPAGTDWVVDALRHAAARAGAHGALEAAMTYLRRALDEPPRPDLLPRVMLDLARVEALAAEPAAPARFAAAYEAATDPVIRAEAAVHSALMLFQSGQADAAVQMLVTSAEELQERDPELALEVQAQLVALAIYDPVAAERHLAKLDGVQHSDLDRSRGGRTLLSQLAYRLLLRSEDAGRATQFAERAIAGGKLLTDRGAEGFELTSVALTLILGDRLESAAQLLDGALALVRDQGSRHGFAHVAFLRSQIAYRRGMIRDVEAEAQASLDIALPARLAVGVALDATMLVLGMVERGALHEAVNVLRVTGLADGDVPPHAPFNLVLGARGRLRVALGDVNRGLDDLRECGRRNARLGFRMPLFSPWRADTALILHALGNVEEAVKLADEELAAATDWGTPGVVGGARRVRAMLLPPRDAVDELRAACAALELSPARLEHAKALVALGAVLRRINHRADARSPLLEGMDLAHRCGATVLHDTARAELASIGLRPRTSRLTGVEALTGSERRVAQLAVGGRSNTDIAQTLFVTRKTVEKHLGNVYGKLGITSRGQLIERYAAAFSE